MALPGVAQKLGSTQCGASDSDGRSVVIEVVWSGAGLIVVTAILVVAFYFWCGPCLVRQDYTGEEERGGLKAGGQPYIRM